MPDRTPSEVIELLERHFAQIKVLLTPKQKDEPIDQMKKLFVLNEVQFKDVMGNMRELAQALTEVDKTLERLKLGEAQKDENAKLIEKHTLYKERLQKKFQEFYAVIGTDLKNKLSYANGPNFPKYYKTTAAYYSHCTYHLHISDKQFNNDTLLKAKKVNLKEHFDQFKRDYAAKLDITSITDDAKKFVQELINSSSGVLAELEKTVRSFTESSTPATVPSDEKKPQAEEAKKTLKQNKFQIGNPSKDDWEEVPAIPLFQFLAASTVPEVNQFESIFNDWMNSNESIANRIDTLNEQAAKLDAENRKLSALKAQYNAEKAKLENKGISKAIQFFKFGDEETIGIDESTEGDFYERYTKALSQCKNEQKTLSEKLAEIGQFNKFIDEMEGNNFKDSETNKVFETIKQRDHDYVQRMMHFDSEAATSSEDREAFARLDKLFNDATVQTELEKERPKGTLSAKFFAMFGINAAAEKTLQEFDDALKIQGMGVKYQKLIDPIEKLFIFRSCALGEENVVPNKGKLATLKDELPGISPKQIHRYYLNRLLNNLDLAFGEIHSLHDAEINKEFDMNLPEKFFRNLVKHVFLTANTQEKQREVFTQQMMIIFLESYIGDLNSKLHETVEKPYLFWRTFLTGVFIAAAVSAVMFPLGLSAITIAVTAAAIVGISYAVAFVLNKFKKKTVEKHSDESKAGIKDAINTATKEKDRLEMLILEAVNTTKEHVKEAKEVGALNDNILKSIFELFGSPVNTSPIGSARAWEAEYLYRYRHSLRIEVDLKPHIEDIIKQAKKQTRTMQICLMHLMSPGDDIKWAVSKNALKEYIEKGEEFIQQHEVKYQSFQFKQKMKEQVLEIVAAIPLDKGDLPENLVKFYKKLGGLPEDLQIARTLSFVDMKPLPAQSPQELELEAKSQEKAEEVNSESKEEKKAEVKPMHPLKKAITHLDLDMTNQGNKKILKGDAQYRRAFGLTDLPDIELTKSNMKDYLENSFDFLRSLDKTKPLPNQWNEPYEHSHEYFLYKTLLLKQLAELASPDNRTVSTKVKEEINNFTKTAFPEDNLTDIFRQVRSEALLPKDQQKSDYWNIASAVRVGLCFSLKPMTPKSLVHQQCQGQEWYDKKNILVINSKVKEQLDRPSGEPIYQTQVDKAIQDTEKFFVELNKLEGEKDFSVSNPYLHEACLEVDEVITKVTEKISELQLSKIEKKVRADANAFQAEGNEIDENKIEAEIEKQKQIKQPQSEEIERLRVSLAKLNDLRTNLELQKLIVALKKSGQSDPTNVFKLFKNNHVSPLSFISDLERALQLKGDGKNLSFTKESLRVVLPLVDKILSKNSPIIFSTPALDQVAALR